MACLPFVSVRGAVTSESINVRVPDKEVRVWQARPPLEAGVIKWRWDGADSARLTVTSVVTRTVLLDRSEIVAGANELYGSWTLPTLAAGATGLYDLVLERFAGNASLGTQTARVVALPEAVSLPVANTSAWRKIPCDMATPFAYDAAWTNLSGSATLSLVGPNAVAVTPPLAGSAGFDAFNTRDASVTALGRITANLSFGGTLAYTALLVLQNGTYILMR